MNKYMNNALNAYIARSLICIKLYLEKKQSTHSFWSCKPAHGVTAINCYVCITKSKLSLPSKSYQKHTCFATVCSPFDQFRETDCLSRASDYYLLDRQGCCSYLPVHVGGTVCWVLMPASLVDYFCNSVSAGNTQPLHASGLKQCMKLWKCMRVKE